MTSLDHTGQLSLHAWKDVLLYCLRGGGILLELLHCKLAIYPCLIGLLLHDRVFQLLISLHLLRNTISIKILRGSFLREVHRLPVSLEVSLILDSQVMGWWGTGCPDHIWALGRWMKWIRVHCHREAAMVSEIGFWRLKLLWEFTHPHLEGWLSKLATSLIYSLGTSCTHSFLKGRLI